MFKKRFITSGLLLTLVVSGTSFFAASASAQSEELQEAKNEVLESLQALDQSASGTMRALTPTTTPELEARKTALMKVLEYSFKETEELVDKIDSFTNDSEPHVAASTVYYKKILEGYQGHIEALEAQLGETEITSKEVREMAIEFKKWRLENIDEIAPEVLELDVWLQAREVLLLAQDRYKKIANDVERLDKENIVSREMLDPHLGAANRFLAEARAKQAAAANLVFEEFATLLPTSSVAIATSTPEVATSTPEQPSFAIRLTTQRLLKDVYQTVADAYREFLKMRAKLVN